MITKKMTLLLALVGVFGGAQTDFTRASFRDWLTSMHKAQVKLLRIDWGDPGLCMEYSRSFNPKSKSCSGGRKLVK